MSRASTSVGMALGSSSRRTWVFDPNRGNDIVIRWHAIPGNFRATYPNHEISIGNDRKEIYVTDLNVGRGDAGYDAVAPPPTRR